MTAYTILAFFFAICGVISVIATAARDAYDANPKVKAKHIARLIAQDRLQRGLK